MTGIESEEKKTQAVWIVRYGLTKFPLVEYAGPYDSPIHPEDGVEHAKAIGKRIRKDLDSLGDNTEFSYIYTSPFQRTTETAHLIANEVQTSSNVKVRVEEGLTEWQQASLLVDPSGVRTFPKSRDDLVNSYDSIDMSYNSLNPAVPDDSNAPGAPKFEESEDALFVRCSKTMSSILDQAKGESLVVVSHAPCDQAIAVFFEGKSLEDSTLQPWPLGGVTRFSKTGSSWQMDYYGNTDHMPGDYKKGLKVS